MLPHKMRTQVSKLVEPGAIAIADLSELSTSLDTINPNKSNECTEIALMKIIEEVIELQQNHDEILTLDELIKTNLSFILKRMDDILEGNSIMGLLKVPLNQALASHGEVFNDPHSKETCIYLFSENSKKLALEMAKKRASNANLTPPNTAHSCLFKEVLSSGKALWIQHSSEMPLFSATHPQMNSLFLTAISINDSPVALFGIANAVMNEQQCKAVQNILPSIWRRAIIHAAQMHTMQRQIRQEHYIDKLYPKFIGEQLKANNFSTESLTINYENVAVFFCDIKDFTDSSK